MPTCGAWTTNPGFPAAADEVLAAVQGAVVLPVLPRRRAPRPRRGAGPGRGGLPVQRRRRRARSWWPGTTTGGCSRWAWAPTASATRPHYVERGDLDQAQHDAVRDVFYVPGAATLVRADLFAALGGYDPGISFHGDDLDLCWRAHVAGARVVVAPAARVAHLEALGVRRPVDDRRRLQTRHRLRVLRVADSVRHAAAGDPGRVPAGAARGPPVRWCWAGFRHARDVASAWVWNVRHRRAAPADGAARSAGCGGPRTATSASSRPAAAPGSRRTCGASSGGRTPSPAPVGSWSPTSGRRGPRPPWSCGAWSCCSGCSASRELLFGTVTSLRWATFQPLLGPGQSLSRWVSGYQSVGSGHDLPRAHRSRAVRRCSGPCSSARWACCARC